MSVYSDFTGGIPVIGLLNRFCIRLIGWRSKGQMWTFPSNISTYDFGGRSDSDTVVWDFPLDYAAEANDGTVPHHGATQCNGLFTEPNMVSDADVLGRICPFLGVDVEDGMAVVGPELVVSGNHDIVSNGDCRSFDGRYHTSSRRCNIRTYVYGRILPDSDEHIDSMQAIGSNSESPIVTVKYQGKRLDTSRTVNDDFVVPASKRYGHISVERGW